MADDHFCNPMTTPPDLLEAVPEFSTLRAWCKSASAADLSMALECIYVHHAHHRQVVEDEIAARHQADAKTRGEAAIAQTERHHSERQWWTRFSAVSAVVIAVASFLAGRLWPTPQVSELERRVTELERHQLAPTASASAQLPEPPPLSLTAPVQTPAPSISTPPTQSEPVAPEPKQP